MKLAFYAPMKPPDHATPSGDRTIARGMIAAVEGTGAEVTLASRLRSRDGQGDGARQAEIIAQAEAEVARLLQTEAARHWDGWVTYHNYYKAPDLLGPAVSAALNIPYVQIESTRARKRLSGPWERFAERAEAATDAAAVVFYLSERDGKTLDRDAPEGQTLLHLRPFLQREVLPAVTHRNDGPMLSVGMMRDGDKLASYRLIAEVLARLPDLPWALEIAGDGPARAEVEALMAPFAAHVTVLGALDTHALNAAYGRASLMLWPGVNEALGLAYLEAQAAGLPIVAQDRPGMREVLAPGPYPSVDDGPEGLARMIEGYLRDPESLTSKSAAALAHVAAHHLMPAAVRRVAQGLAAAGIMP